MEKLGQNGIHGDRASLNVDLHNDDHRKKRSSSRTWFLLTISAIVILICALALQYHRFYLEPQPPTPAPSTKDVNKPLKKPEVRPNVEDLLGYNPDAMIRFTDNLLQAYLDDFVTVEKNPIQLKNLSRFNDIHFAPRILSLVKLDPFKFVKFSLKRPCHLWPDTFSCTKLSCNIKFCDRSELPESYLMLETNPGSCPTDSPKELSKLDQTLKHSTERELNRLFECTRDDSEESQYYDLVLNPERFTGYDGSQIWKAIYEENCFPMMMMMTPSPGQRHPSNAIFSRLQNFGCYEERAFYRIISGLHTSINIHLTAIDHKFKDHFGPNPKGYFKRFYGRQDYFKNLFFIYLIELSALYKSQSYLLDRIQWDLIEDKVQAKEAIQDLLNTETWFKWHFDEKVLFHHETIAEHLASHFYNITFNIMDCVSCDKCRLWGKVQTNGLGTAFKILLTNDLDRLRLSHHEITCLLNAVARLSFSVRQVSEFRHLMQTERDAAATGTVTGGDGETRSFVNYLN